MKKLSMHPEYKKVFLGGTCNDSDWRDKLISLLEVNYFNPVVDDWTPECQEKEKEERENCTHCLYVITPKMQGVYSIAEVVDDSNKRPDKTIFCFLKKDGSQEFDKFQTKSLNAVKDLVKENGGQCFETLEEIADYLNKQ